MQSNVLATFQIVAQLDGITQALLVRIAVHSKDTVMDVIGLSNINVQIQKIAHLSKQDVMVQHIKNALQAANGKLLALTMMEMVFMPNVEIIVIM